jgi:hypothetical protein
MPMTEPQDMVDESEPTVRFIEQVIYRPESPLFIGSLLVLCDDGKLYEKLDGSTAWNEVEGP